MRTEPQICEHEWRLPDHGYGHGVGAMFDPNGRDLPALPTPWVPDEVMTDMAWCRLCGTLYRYGRLHVPSQRR